MLEKMDEFFNRRVVGYEDHQLNEIDFAREFYPFTADCLPGKADVKILDLGCGTGLELGYYFQRCPQAEVVCIDLAEDMLRVLREKFPDKNLEIRQGSYFDLPFGTGVYDAAVSVESLHHFTMDEKAPLYRKLFAALAEGGYFLLTDYFAPSEEEEHFYRQELLRLKAQQGIADKAFYHYDTPLTVAHEIQVLRQAGFSSVRILGQWDATCTIKAEK